MPVRYRIDSKASALRVLARSSVHDTETAWSGIEGTVDTDLDDLASTRAEITVDMRTADAGDWLKNRKLRKDMDFEQHPQARFQLVELRDIQRTGADVQATVIGTLSWRGRSVEVEATGSGTLGNQELSASGRFDLDVTRLGVKAPKILMFKVEDVVTCEITLRAAIDS